MTSKDELKARVCAEIDRQAERIVAFGDEIMRNPETGFREHDTARRVIKQFVDMGLEYRSGLAGTGVKARMPGRSRRRTVSILGELDSLLISDHPYADPGTGAAHACGHNAMAASMLGAGLGLQPVMDELDGDVVLFGVPAEECIELDWRMALREAGDLEFMLGKAELIRLGEFDDIDMALITHTEGAGDPLATMSGTANGSLIKRVRFVGRSAHAGNEPWSAVNASKALTLAVSAVDAQRETFRDSDMVRISHLITHGGEAVSAIPGAAEMEMMIRARTVEAMEDASRKVDRALRAGSVALGAEVEINTVTGYLPLVPDEPLVDVVDANSRDMLGDEHVLRHGGHLGSSTDVGDLGRVMPVAHPFAASGNDAPMHSNGYFVRDHVLAAVNPAKFMAMSAVDLLADGASGAEEVIRDSGPKLGRDDYVALRRRLDSVRRYRGDEE
ncbi:amidohydrolase [Haloactinomyces albus]|uniref:Peptidase M20 domain-containing protein 2 n=1 Tax=Haloactinomyces albus TaxID=1352928 RepID=A0AAE3ZEW0_9ACTN|nr:amidohydrolase [Haloactinomyces albus]MDR7302581.1 amidohydrolase [Haloactinomyces albus]